MSCRGAVGDERFAFSVFREKQIPHCARDDKGGWGSAASASNKSSLGNLLTELRTKAPRWTTPAKRKRAMVRYGFALRILITVAALGVWFWTQSLLGARISPA